MHLAQMFTGATKQKDMKMIAKIRYGYTFLEETRCPLCKHIV